MLFYIVRDSPVPDNHRAAEAYATHVLPFGRLPSPLRKCERRVGIW